MHEAKPMPNGLRYESGQKRCTFCGIFFLIDDVRCPCCKVVLRTNPRSRHKNQKRWKMTKVIVIDDEIDVKCLPLWQKK